MQIEGQPKGQQLGQIQFRKPNLITECRRRGTSERDDCYMKIHFPITGKDESGFHVFQYPSGTTYSYRGGNGGLVRKGPRAYQIRKAEKLSRAQITKEKE